MDLSTLKQYGYVILLQIVAVLTYMQLNIGKPKDEAYFIGAALVLGSGLLSWLGRSPTNALKRWQAPSPKEIAKSEAGDRKTDPIEVDK